MKQYPKKKANLPIWHLLTGRKANSMKKMTHVESSKCQKKSMLQFDFWFFVRTENNSNLKQKSMRSEYVANIGMIVWTKTMTPFQLPQIWTPVWLGGHCSWIQPISFIFKKNLEPDSSSSPHSFETIYYLDLRCLPGHYEKYERLNVMLTIPGSILLNVHDTYSYLCHAGRRGGGRGTCRGLSFGLHGWVPELRFTT